MRQQLTSPSEPSKESNFIRVYRSCGLSSSKDWKLYEAMPVFDTPQSPATTSLAQRATPARHSTRENWAGTPSTTSLTAPTTRAGPCQHSRQHTRPSCIRRVLQGKRLARPTPADATWPATPAVCHATLSLRSVHATRSSRTPPTPTSALLLQKSSRPPTSSTRPLDLPLLCQTSTNRVCRWDGKHGSNQSID